MKYNELYPLSLDQGIGLISELAELESIPFNTLSEEQKIEIERAYNVRSGFKSVISTFEAAPSNARARLLSAMFAQKWSKLWKVYLEEYNLLDAYTMLEEHVKKVDRTRDDTTEYGRVTEDSGTDTGTVSNEQHSQFDGTDGVFGFNSVAASSSDTSTETSTNTDTETRNLANSRRSTNSGTDTFNREEGENETLTISKKGNIGYNSPQELIRQELDLWKEPFFATVFRDIDDMITLSVFEI